MKKASATTYATHSSTFIINCWKKNIKLLISNKNITTGDFIQTSYYLVYATTNRLSRITFIVSSNVSTSYPRLASCLDILSIEGGYRPLMQLIAVKDDNSFVQIYSLVKHNTTDTIVSIFIGLYNYLDQPNILVLIYF